MISWLWIIAAFYLGLAVGVVLTCLFTMSKLQKPLVTVRGVKRSLKEFEVARGKA